MTHTDMVGIAKEPNQNDWPHHSCFFRHFFPSRACVLRTALLSSHVMTLAHASRIVESWAGVARRHRHTRTSVVSTGERAPRLRRRMCVARRQDYFTCLYTGKFEKEGIADQLLVFVGVFQGQFLVQRFPIQKTSCSIGFCGSRRSTRTCAHDNLIEV